MENKVELLGYYGGDLSHACSAWTSTSRDLTPEKIERIPKLLKMLAKDGHHTPFEKSTLHFLVTVEDATHIQLIKHRIGVSINGESARYKELKDDKYYTPPELSVISSCPDNRSLFMLQKEYQNHMKNSYDLYHRLLNAMTEVYGRKRAKEAARFVLPKANQLTLDIMFNWRSFMHFQGLRNEEHAQFEIEQLAKEMLRLIIEIPQNPFRYSMEAFGL